MNWKFAAVQDPFLGEILVHVEAEFDGRRAATTCHADELNDVVKKLEAQVKNEAIPE